MEESSRIYMNYRQAMEQADQLDAQARQLSELAGARLEETITRMGTHWKGENANAYLAKCRILQEKLRKTARGLSNAAAALRTSAKRTYQAELRALELSRARNYQG